MMYPVHIAGMEGQMIVVRPGRFWSGPQLLVNGQPAPKGAKRGQMLLRRNDGREVIATWKPQALGFDTPQLVVEDQTIHVVAPLKWYEWLWSSVPLLLIILGGALGAITGMVGVAINTKVFRSTLPVWIKFLVSAVVSLIVVVGYGVVAFSVLGVLRR